MCFTYYFNPCFSADAVSTSFTESDHHSICTKLELHAAKWREIGGALGFKEGELDNIQSNPLLLVQSLPQSWLKQMITQLLQWAPGDGRGSTSVARKEFLHAALLKINLGKLAQQFS